MTKKVIALIVALMTFANVAYALEFQNVGQTNGSRIKVILNGSALNFDVAPEIVRGRVMVPLRGIFEAMELKVSWDENNRQIIGSQDGLTVKLAVGKYDAYINDTRVTLDSPPIASKGRTLVPIRFIAEATGQWVKWDPYTSTVKIKEPIEIIVKKQDNAEFLTGYYEDDYVKLSHDGTTLEVSGKLRNKRAWFLEFSDMEENVVLRTERETVNRRGFFNTKVDLSDLRGKHKMTLYIGDESYGILWNIYSDIPITVDKRQIIFDEPPTYESNHEKAIQASRLDPEDYLGLNHIKEGERKILVDLAHHITSGIANDYDKLLAIHDWVVNNIYYNYDGFYDGNYGKTDAYGTYDTKKSVCQGYAELTMALCRAVGIPTRVVSGFALGVGIDKVWNDENLNASSNHAWNEAFIGNRWIILDTTWDTFNKYEGEKFIDGEKHYRYFDISLEYFS